MAIMPYLLLTIAIIAEVFGDNMMKLSDGFSRKPPIAGMVAGYAVSFYLLSLTFEMLPLGFAYAVWNGGGIALTAVVSAILWHERFNWKKTLGILMIMGGVVLLRLGL